MPGASVVGKLAATLDAEAAGAARAASRRFAASIEMMAGHDVAMVGERPSHEKSTGGRWSSLADLATDTALVPFQDVVTSTVALGAESIRQTAATAAGDKVLAVGLKHLEREPAEGKARFAAGELRQSFVAVTIDSGAVAVREAFGLFEAALRLSFSDTRKMHQAIDTGLVEMQRLVSAAEMQDLLPTAMVSEALQKRAGQVLRRAPLLFLQALDDNSEGWLARPRAIFAAAVEDAENLRFFLVTYPQVLTMVGADAGKLLIAGKIHFSEMEAFLEGRRMTGEGGLSN